MSVLTFLVLAGFGVSALAQTDDTRIGTVSLPIIVTRCAIPPCELFSAPPDSTTFISAIETATETSSSSTSSSTSVSAAQWSYSPSESLSSSSPGPTDIDIGALTEKIASQKQNRTLIISGVLVGLFLIALVLGIILMIRRRNHRRSRDSKFIVDPESPPSLEPRPLDSATNSWYHSSTVDTDSDRVSAEQALVRHADLERQSHKIQEEMEQLKKMALPGNSAEKPEAGYVNFSQSEKFGVLQVRSQGVERHRDSLDDAPPGYLETSA
ncbi:hypothetical protein C8J57DRAFT_1530664 [Mycena rebaudengoi]|nr:hypothetical protein C8J57DRAFT_1530664 [Mycena rebaudengoi]